MSEGDLQPGEFLHFTVDAALLKELGERLVGKPYVALAELVKNAYDADATEVEIEFGPDEIVVSDNGDGMSREDFKGFWMRIGTTHKQRALLTSRFKRSVTGAKGVGRLSVQFLGSALTMWSVPRSRDHDAISATVDWKAAQKSKDLVKSGAMLRPVARTGVLPKGFRHGTRVRITGLHQTWGDEELSGLASELWILRPPKPLDSALTTKDKFDLKLKGVASDAQKKFDLQLTRAFRGWIAEISGSLSTGRSGSSAEVKVKFHGEGKTHVQRFPVGSKLLDKVTFVIRVYNLSGRQEGGVKVGHARDYFKQFGGVHVYDQGFRLPFYGGEGEDWLRLEVAHSHRLMRSQLVPENLRGGGDLRDLPTNGRVFGLVRVSTSHERTVASPQDVEKGSYLNIQVTRDRFIDNQAFQALRNVVRWSLDYYAYLSSARRHSQMLRGEPEFVPIPDSMALIRQRLQELRTAVPKGTLPRLDDIEVQFKEFEKAEDVRDRAFRRERILLGALATAGMSSIALEHELGKDLTAVKKAIKDLESNPLSASDADVIQGLKSLVSRISDARQLLSPLMEEENRDLVAKLKVAPTIGTILSGMKPLLRSLRVTVAEIDPDLRFPNATLAAWAAIVQNVVINAMNATLDTANRKIVITAGTHPDFRTDWMRVEDNGAGVDLTEAEELFKPFERRLKLSLDRQRLGLGGVGLGLTIVRIIVNSIGCSARFVRPTRGMKTAFEITWKHERANSDARTDNRRRRQSGK